jgi:transposase-like protein
MERYTPDTDDFEEDEIPAWLLKQQEDAQRAAELANKNEKIVYKEGDQVGNFLFVRYIKFKNRAMFRCPDCGKQFQYNIYTIKNKKRCKWYKFHN